MRKDSGQAVLNSTMAELAFMLVFVFAIFAAVGNAHEPDTPNAAARVLAEEKENVSCLYVPWDPQGEGRAQSGKFIDEGQYTRYSLNTAENNNTEKRPAIRSLLQFYWLRMEDTRFATVETVYLHFNLDQLSDSSKNEKPFLYLNSDARAALFYMELRLNDFLYDYATNCIYDLNVFKHKIYITFVLLSIFSNHHMVFCINAKFYCIH